MALPIIGSVHQTMQMMKLNMKWQQRKSNPLMPREDEDPEITRLRKQAEDVRKSNALAAIRGKMLSGADLTSEEMEYLKVNNPQMYQQAVEARQEREAYKKQLENCKTQEEVDRLHINRLQSFVSQAKTISNNPNIPKAQKKALLEGIMGRAMGIQSVKQKFVQSGRYERLPSEEEIRKEERERAEQLEQAAEEQAAAEQERQEQTEAAEGDGSTEPLPPSGAAEQEPEQTQPATDETGKPKPQPVQRKSRQAAGKSTPKRIAAGEHGKAHLDQLARMLAEVSLPQPQTKTYTPRGAMADEALLRRTKGRKISTKA